MGVVRPCPSDRNDIATPKILLLVLVRILIKFPPENVIRGDLQHESYENLWVQVNQLLRTANLIKQKSKKRDYNVKKTRRFCLENLCLFPFHCAYIDMSHCVPTVFLVMGFK